MLLAVEQPAGHVRAALRLGELALPHGLLVQHQLEGLCADTPRRAQGSGVGELLAQHAATKS